MGGVVMRYETHYTPREDEFCLGFQYERKEVVLVDQGWHKVHMKQWVDKIADRKYIMNYWGAWEFLRDLEDGLIRVKYLDAEDLNEIGFKHIGGKLITDVGQEYVLDNKRYFVHLTYTRFSNRTVLRLETSVEEHSVKTLVVHSIGIKNKFELYKLMTQLNIL